MATQQHKLDVTDNGHGVDCKSLTVHANGTGNTIEIMWNAVKCTLESIDWLNMSPPFEIKKTGMGLAGHYQAPAVSDQPQKWRYLIRGTRADGVTVFFHDPEIDNETP